MYLIYLIDDDGSYIELDTEELDFGVEFKISTLEDLSMRIDPCSVKPRHAISGMGAWLWQEVRQRPESSLLPGDVG